MSFTNELSIAPLTKEGVQLAVNQIINDLNSGTISPLLLKTRIKYLENIFDGVKERLDELALDEAQTYGEKSFAYQGLKVEVCEVATKYDFSNCGDPEYKEFTEEKAIIERNIKARETFLKALSGEHTTVTDGGEVITLYPPVKSSKTGLKFTV